MAPGADELTNRPAPLPFSLPADITFPGHKDEGQLREPGTPG
jgi:hypothetical protein